MKVNPTDAAAMAGVTRKTVYEDMKKGLLSYEITDKKKRLIQVAELERVYGNVSINETETDSNTNDTPEVKEGDTREKTSLNERLSLEQEERKRERGQLLDQIEHLRDMLKGEQEERRKITALLTDQSKDKDQRAGDQEKKYEELVKANEMLRKQNRRVLYELKAQKEMSLFERLFGKKETKDLNRGVGG